MTLFTYYLLNTAITWHYRTPCILLGAKMTHWSRVTSVGSVQEAVAGLEVLYLSVRVDRNSDPFPETLLSMAVWLNVQFVVSSDSERRCRRQSRGHVTGGLIVLLHMSRRCTAAYHWPDQTYMYFCFRCRVNNKEPGDCLYSDEVVDNTSRMTFLDRNLVIVQHNPRVYDTSCYKPWVVSRPTSCRDIDRT